MYHSDLINLYKKESSDVVNNLSSDDLLGFVNLVLDAYKSEQKTKVLCVPSLFLTTTCLFYIQPSIIISSFLGSRRFTMAAFNGF